MSCDKPATILLFEVYGSRNQLIPWGTFCAEHWAAAKKRRNDEGQRMAVQALPADSGQPPCAEGEI